MVEKITCAKCGLLYSTKGCSESFCKHFNAGKKYKGCPVCNKDLELPTEFLNAMKRQREEVQKWEGVFAKEAENKLLDKIIMNLDVEAELQREQFCSREAAVLDKMVGLFEGWKN